MINSFNPYVINDGDISSGKENVWPCNHAAEVFNVTGAIGRLGNVREIVGDWPEKPALNGVIIMANEGNLIEAMAEGHRVRNTSNGQHHKGVVGRKVNCALGKKLAVHVRETKTISGDNRVRSRDHVGKQRRQDRDVTEVAGQNKELAGDRIGEKGPREIICDKESAGRRPGRIRDHRRLDVDEVMIGNRGNISNRHGYPLAIYKLKHGQVPKGVVK